MTQDNSMPHNRRAAGCPYRPDADLVRQHQDEKLHRVRVPSAQLGAFEAVLVARAEDSRTVLSDIRYEAGFAFERDLTGPRTMMTQPGTLLNYDGEEHTRYRRMHAGAFTVRRVRAMAGAIERIVETHLDAVEREGPGADLIETFAGPVPLMVICELLGAPEEDHEGIRARSSIATSVGTTLAVQQENFGAMTEYMGRLIAAHRREPGDNILGDLVRRHGAELTDDELVGMGNDILVAGHETLTSTIGMSVLTLLRHPDQLALVRDEESVAANAVEELLRLLSVAPPLVRQASCDLTLNGQEIRAGERVIISGLMANHGADVAPGAPHDLDVRRRPVRHLAFGYGPHQCLGQQLARLELRTVLPALLRRFPALRLAVPFEQLEYRTDALVFGVRSLPVAW
ncbi:cytochrome P450 [Streptomyces sp. NPDC001985]|uniref:cytochrome P450 n=1 Tax=Streptomyces sp. NPDC001985 TaxID=3154406 RepID=UPI0033266162